MSKRIISVTGEFNNELDELKHEFDELKDKFDVFDKLNNKFD